jgi:hypothetical protein
MKTSTTLKILACGYLLLLATDLQAQVIKKINFSPAEGYTNGPLWGQPAAEASTWTCVSANTGDTFYTEDGDHVIVNTVTNEALRIHPDHTGSELGVIYWAIAFPVQKKGPVTVTWDWQFFPTNEIPSDYDPTNNTYNAQLQGTDLGFTLSDSLNRALDGDPYAVFNELCTPNRMGARCDARMGTGDCDGGGTWLDVGPEYKDGKKLHMKLVVYFGDDGDPYNNTFDLWAQREGEELWQTADHNFMRRCPTAENGIDCITMWLNNGDLETYIIVDNIQVSGPNAVEPPTVQITKTVTNVRLIYTGTLQSADTPQGPYIDMAGPSSSPLEIPASGNEKYYRACN